MADAGKRLTTDTLIDFGSITINADGRVTGVADYRQTRSPNANKNDGFVYTSSTRQGTDGKFYYRYTGIDMAANITTLPIYGDANRDAAFTSLEHYRNMDTDEGTINYKNGTGSTSRIDGHPTATNNFLYNEGNEFVDNSDTKDHSVDGEDSLGTLNSSLGDGYTNETGISFYDRYADKWTPELTQVRGMQGANIAT